MRQDIFVGEGVPAIRGRATRTPISEPQEIGVRVARPRIAGTRPRIAGTPSPENALRADRLVPRESAGSSVARVLRSLPCLDLGDHAPADAGRDRHPLL